MALKWKRPAFFLDVQSCTGCKTCMVACKDKNDLDLGIRWRRVVEYCGGQWLPLPGATFQQTVFCYYISVSCNHCNEPICVEVCPTGAMNQDENGIVTVNQKRCVGCKLCQWACPYGAPQYDLANGRMGKCNLCRDMLESGGRPACVAACPTRALNLIDLDQARPDSEKYPPLAPLPDNQYTRPNMVIKPHKMGKPIDSTAGRIANPEENKDV